MIRIVYFCKQTIKNLLFVNLSDFSCLLKTSKRWYLYWFDWKCERFWHLFEATTTWYSEHWEWYIYREVKIKESRVIEIGMSNWRFRRNTSQLSVYLHLNFLNEASFWNDNSFLDYDNFNSSKFKTLFTTGLDDKILLLDEKISSTYKIDKQWKFVSFGLNGKFSSTNEKISSTFQINKQWKFVWIGLNNSFLFRIFTINEKKTFIS